MLAPGGRSSKTIAVFVAIAGLSNFLEGYSSSYPNTAGNSFRKFINDSYIQRSEEADGLTNWEYTWLWSLLLNIWFIGYLLGTFMTPFFTDTWGRKNALLGANVVNVFGTLFSIMAIPTRMPELLLVGRMVGAAGSGVSFGSLILFLQETTPTSLRGTCSFLSEVSYIAVNVIGMGMGMDVALGRHLIWLISVSLVPGVLSVFVLLPMKESPKYLLINRADRNAAYQALIFYRGNQIDHIAVMNDFMKEADSTTADMSLRHSVAEVFRQPHLRRALVIGILSLQIIVGIWPIIYISTELLEAYFALGIAQVSSFAFISANFIASVFGMCVIERLGRRPMLIYCGIANTLCLCFYIFFDRTAFYYADVFKYGCVVSLVCYGITYGVALGPIAFFITSELVPQRYRALTQSMVFSFNTLMNFIVSFATLPMYRLIDIWAFIPLFVLPSVASIGYLIVYMPETRGREIYEIVDELRLGVGGGSAASDAEILADDATKPSSLSLSASVNTTSCTAVEEVERQGGGLSNDRVTKKTLVSTDPIAEALNRKLTARLRCMTPNASDDADTLAVKAEIKAGVSGDGGSVLISGGTSSS